jgi:hypothetical protein
MTARHADCSPSAIGARRPSNRSASRQIWRNSNGDTAMATHLVKVLYEGEITKALKNAEPGITSGGANVYEVQDVPASVTLDDVIAAFRAVGGKPKHKDHEVKWADLVA